METAGQRFKQIRLKLGLSQSDFGQKIGLSKSGISAVENNKTFMSSEILRSLFIDFNVNLNYLICGAGDMFNKTDNNIDDILFIKKVKAVLKAEGII